MLKQNVTCDFASFQMFYFYHDFRIKNTFVWGDLSCEDAEGLLKSMANSQDIGSASVTSTDFTIPTITAATPTQQISALSTSRPKNARRS
jgi:hypothetical protein